MEDKNTSFLLKIDLYKFIITKIFILLITVTIVYGVVEIIKTLAGLNTVANIAISFLSDIKFNISVLWSVTTTWLWRRERKAKNKLIEEKSSQIEKIQLTIDKNRGTSLLKKTGETNEKDL